LVFKFFENKIFAKSTFAKPALDKAFRWIAKIFFI